MLDLCWRPVPACILASPHLPSRHPTSGPLGEERCSHHCPPRLPASAAPQLPCTQTAVPESRMTREPESFSVLPQLRPPSRNASIPSARPCSAWSHEQLAGMVRYERWSWRRERFLSASIVSWARTVNGHMGAGGEHPQQGCLNLRKATLAQLAAGAIVTLLWPSYCPPAKGGKALQAASDGSVS
jgi:hypothetical protein